MASGQVAGARVHATLEAATRRFLGRDLRCAGVVRRDHRVREAIRAQVPVLTRHPCAVAARDVEAIAAGMG